MMIMNDISILSRYSRTFFERRLSEINVGFTEQLILMYLCKCDSVNQDTIAKYFMLDKGAIAKTLNKLEEKAFITRTDNPNNKREKLISITKNSKDIIVDINKELREWHNYLFTGLNEEEIDQFTSIIKKISINAANVINGGKNENTEQEE